MTIDTFERAICGTKTCNSLPHSHSHSKPAGSHCHVWNSARQNTAATNYLTFCISHFLYLTFFISRIFYISHFLFLAFVISRVFYLTFFISHFFFKSRNRFFLISQFFFYYLTFSLSRIFPIFLFCRRVKSFISHFYSHFFPKNCFI